jgi:hypothetical protein
MLLNSRTFASQAKTRIFASQNVVDSSQHNWQKAQSDWLVDSFAHLPWLIRTTTITSGIELTFPRSTIGPLYHIWLVIQFNRAAQVRSVWHDSIHIEPQRRSQLHFLNLPKKPSSPTDMHAARWWFWNQLFACQFMRKFDDDLLELASFHSWLQIQVCDLQDGTLETDATLQV